MFSKSRKTPKGEDQSDNQIRIVLPEEAFSVMEFTDSNLPCVAVVNSGLLDFEHKKIFHWHLSVIIDFDEIIENGMPSVEEREVVDPFCEKLDQDIKAGGNALFLLRETWNQTRRLVWMVYDPEIADQHLQYIIEHLQHPRPFDYRMVEDFNWEQAKWYFDSLRAPQ